MADLIPAFPFDIQNGNTPDADQVMANLAHLRDWINARFGNASDKQLWVADTSGRATPRTISGDVTNSSTGAVTIGPKKVTTGKIDDKAVDTGQIADDAVGPGQLNLSVTEQVLGSPVDLPHAWTTVLGVTPSAGTYIVFGLLAVVTSINNNGVQARFSGDTNPRGATFWTTGEPYLLTLVNVFTVDGATPIQLQAQKDQPSGSSSDVQADAGAFAQTRMLRFKIGA